MDMATPNTIPDDLLIDASDEIRIRQDLVLTALGHRQADRALRVGRLLDVHSRTWSEDQEIVFKGRRIVWVGPAGSYPGEVRERVDTPARAIPQVKLRSMDEVRAERAQSPAQALGYFAPPRDAAEVRSRRRGEVVVWASVCVMLACAVALGIWFLAK